MKGDYNPDRHCSIIWFTGESGSGKSTLAFEMEKRFHCIVLDGDEMRECISTNSGFSREDRKEHNLRVANLVKVLSRQVPVIVAVIAPIKDVRKEIDDICSPVWVHINKNIKSKPPEYFYEKSNNYPLIINTEKNSIEENVKILENFLEENNLLARK